jgi:hypothetical protein
MPKTMVLNASSEVYFIKNASQNAVSRPLCRSNKIQMCPAQPGACASEQRSMPKIMALNASSEVYFIKNAIQNAVSRPLCRSNKIQTCPAQPGACTIQLLAC